LSTLSTVFPFDLAVFDLDGTLVRRDLTIEPRTLSRLHKLQTRGLKLTVATGRSRQAAWPYVLQLGTQFPVILYNGSVVIDPRTNKVAYERRIRRAQARAALRLAKTFAIEPQLYVQPDDERYFVSEIGAFSKAFTLKDGIQPHVVGDLETFLKQDPLKLLIIGDRGDLLRFRQLLVAEGVGVEAVLSEHNFLELLPPNSSKGTALVRLCGQHNIPLERVLAFGDNPNDAEMLAAAGLGVAMATGDEALRRAADLVVESVAAGLDHVFGDASGV